jgi:hypothetical protein
LMPLTTVGSAVLLCALMMGLLCLGLALDFTFGLLQRGECLLDTLALFFSDHAGQHLAEVRVLGA